ncbi:hypothetical protein N0A02_23900 [Paraburkholderia acidicola]|uniref:Uncharacterized protein n=1 Tax=Paraburkholderia acidicola TaxID=1912599 RepID=A0ABV1LU31_9BURK
MRKDVPHVQLLHIEMHGSNQSELVATNIKNVEVANLVNGVESPLQTGKIREKNSFNGLSPDLKWNARIGMLHRKIDQRLVGDDSHEREKDIIST